MKRFFIYFMITLPFFLTSCNDGSDKEEAFKEYLSPDKNFKVSMPISLNLDKRSRNNFMAFTKENVFIYISKQKNASLNEDVIKINQTGDKFRFDLVEETDSTKLYKYSKGLLVLYEYYLIKRIKSGYYLITIKDNISNKNNIINTGLKIYSSLKDNVKNDNKEIKKNKIVFTPKTYSSKSYVIQYPSDWVITENPDESTNLHIGSTKTNIGFTITHFSTNESLDVIQEASDNNMKQAGFDIVIKGKQRIDKSKAYFTTYFMINQNADVFTAEQNITIMSYLFKKGNILYNIKFGNIENKEHEQLVNNIINSFKFK